MWSSSDQKLFAVPGVGNSNIDRWRILDAPIVAVEGGGMRTAFMLILTVVVYSVMKESFRVTSTLVYLSVLGPLLFLSMRAWRRDQFAAQDRRNEDLRNREREAQKQRAPDQRNVSTTDDEPLVGPLDESSDPLPQPTQSGDNLILYLRPFELDHLRRFRNPRLDTLGSYFIPFYRLILPDEVTLDEVLRWHLRARGEVIALGEQEEGFGATKWTTSESDWKDDFQTLVRRARMILVLPNMNAGTVWEIAEICSSPELLQKTVFVALLLDSVGPDSESGSGSNPITVRALLCKLGCELPDDIDLDEAVMFDGDGSLRDRVTLLKPGFLQVKVHRRALHQLSDNCEPKPFVFEAAD